MRWLLALVTACYAATPRLPPRDPASLARQIFFEQLAAARRGDDAALRGTFAPEAVVLAADSLPGPTMTSELWLHGPPARVDAVTDVVIYADGNADGVWLIAQFSVTVNHTTTVYRLSEVATAARDWHVVAAGIASTPSFPLQEVHLDHMRGSTAKGELAEGVRYARFTGQRTAKRVIFANAYDQDPVSGDGRERFLEWIKDGWFLHGDVREIDADGIHFLQARIADGSLLLLVTALVKGHPLVVLAHRFSK